MATLISSFVLVLAILLSVISFFLLRDGDLPNLPQRKWGSSPDSIAIRPYQVNVSDHVLKDLRTRLALEVATLDERIEDPLEGIAFEYGMNKKFLKKVTEHWLNKYDWRQREKSLNKFPHFRTTIAGLDIHFQHVKSQKRSAGKSETTTRPLLLLHGWPGSIVEYQKLIPLLMDPKDSKISFEVN